MLHLKQSNIAKNDFERKIYSQYCVQYFSLCIELITMVPMNNKNCLHKACFAKFLRKQIKHTSLYQFKLERKDHLQFPKNENYGGWGECQ